MPNFENSQYHNEKIQKNIDSGEFHPLSIGFGFIPLSLKGTKLEPFKNFFLRYFCCEILTLTRYISETKRPTENTFCLITPEPKHLEG